MGGQEKQLNHDEVWDDSVLIDSWNEALEEYKKYHSIHAKRGRLTDEEKRQYLGVPNSTTNDAQQNVEGVAIGAEVAPEPAVPIAARGTQNVAPGPPPQMLLGSVRDENLKKLLMSWYYAGYYTGLYEGQQQAQQENASEAP